MTVENDKLANATITMAELTDIDKFIADGQKLINEVIEMDAKTVVSEIKLAAGTPTLLPIPMGGWAIPVGVVKVYISAWSDNPPQDLKAFAPEWELVQTSLGVHEKVKYGSLGDRTFGGIFPDGLAEDMLYEPDTGNVDVTIK